MTRPDHRGFFRVHIAGTTVLPAQPTDDSEFANLLPDQSAGMTLGLPVIGADQHELYYGVLDERSGPGEPGPLSGSYMATRTDTTVPFTPGQMLRGRARTYESVSGVSADGLSLFMTSEFRTHVLVRASTDEPWGLPAPNILAAMLPGWRAMPTQDCKRILATFTIGGCHAEQTVWLEGKD
jgi:hypothetical protein